MVLNLCPIPTSNLKLQLLTMKFYLLGLLFFLAQFITAQDYNDPNFDKPVSGYGSDGPYSPTKLETFNPEYLLRKVEIFHPVELENARPSILYCHGYGGVESSRISGLINFIVSKGYNFIFIPYPTVGVSIEERYSILLSGFKKAAREFPSMIDTTKIGVVGHSFGGGASFGVAHHLFSDLNWGSEGRFIYANAQWYSFELTQDDLLNFPENTNLITMLFDDDVTNDHRLAADIFNTISIPDENKDLLLLQTDTINGYIYEANHGVPNSTDAFDAYDYYVYYRLLDALSDYSFNDNEEGKVVALGDGSAEQVTLPGDLKPLIHADSLSIFKPQSFYIFPCDTLLNPRVEYCYTATSSAEISENVISIFPNPFDEMLSISIDGQKANEIMLYDFTGNLVLQQSFLNKINLQNLPSGKYILQLLFDNHISSHQISKR